MAARLSDCFFCVFPHDGKAANQRRTLREAGFVIHLSRTSYDVRLCVWISQGRELKTVNERRAYFRLPGLVFTHSRLYR